MKTENMNKFDVKRQIEDCKLLAETLEWLLDNNTFANEQSYLATALDSLSNSLKISLNTLYDSIK